MAKIQKFIFAIPKWLVIVLFLLLGGAVYALHLWDILEPVSAVLTLGFAFMTWQQTQRVKARTYEGGNEDGDWVVVLQCGRSVVEAVKKSGFEIDKLVDAETLLGTQELSTDDHYRSLAVATYAALTQGQGKRVHLFLAGPHGLTFEIGQMVNIYTLDVTVYQWDSVIKGYKAVPQPDRSWLHHA